MKFSENFLWSIITIEIKDDIINRDDISFCYSIIEKFEQKYSRFIPWNFLDTLNRKKKAVIDTEFYSLINLATRVSEISEWYFDITVQPLLENLWYWISKRHVAENYWYKNIYLKNSDKKNLYNIELQGNVSIEFWAFWKWYLIDVIYDFLEKKYNHFIIDFWWDIKAKWSFDIHLEDPLITWSSIWNISLTHCSIASSSWNRRTFNNTHHLISLKSLKWEDEKVWIFVTHKLAVMADIFATALYLSPISICEKIIKQTPWLNAFILFKSWEKLISDHFPIVSTIK